MNPSKCKFLVKRIEYLGRIIEDGTIKPSVSKTDVLKNAPNIEGFSCVVAPISSLLKKDAVFNWSKQCEHARQLVIEKLTSNPVLCIYETERETELHTDASSIGIGAAIMQKHDIGCFKVVAYFSRKLTLEESKYHSYEQETFAIICALKHFRVYLIGKKIQNCYRL